MTYYVRPKRKNRVFEKIQVWYFYHSVVLFLKNLSEESKTLFGGTASRMFWTRNIGPRAAFESSLRFFCVVGR